MIHTPINIDFQGLTNVPSDYACQDGELATCHNLIPENGELQPINTPLIVESFTLPEGARIAFVHKVTHNGNLHTHYIIKNGNNIYWLEKGASYYNPTFIYSGTVNSITAIGNILCFVEDSSTKYAYWKGSGYTVFNLSDLNYDVNINDTMGETEVGGESGTIFKMTTSISDDWDTAFSDSTVPGIHYSGKNPTLKGASIIFNALDALINKRMAEVGDEWFKYLQFGVVAIRLYDGTYINISNPFVLAPNAISNKFIYRESTKTIGSFGYLHKHTINISMTLSDSLKDIIQGATVFLTAPESFIDTTRAPFRIGDSYNPVYGSGMESDVYSAGFYFRDEKSSLELIDSMSYYRSVDIDTDEFGKDVQLKTVSQTEESLSLADMGRLSYGGTCAITYNSRLHIGNVRKSYFNAFDSSTLGEILLSKGENTYNWKFPGCYLNMHVEAGSLEKATLCDAVFAVTLGDTISNNTLYYKGKIQYPIPPIISFPDTKASRMVVYLKLNYNSAPYKAQFKLRKSNTTGMSYYVHFGDQKIDTTSINYNNYGFDNLGLPQFMQVAKFGLKNFDPVIAWTYTKDNDIFTKITADEYNAALANVPSTIQSTDASPSLVKVSEAENPLVFPAKNSVQVGSAQIQALAANTRPITEGQFGEAPLYAFTDEGVWMLMLGSNMEGTYQARQPVNRYICTDPSGILQIDDAVVYPTEQGIMIQDGSKVTCITDILDGNGMPYNFLDLPHATDILATANIPQSRVDYAYFRNFLTNAKMIYDYYDRRIILFNPTYSYAYVYSLKSQKWGTMECDFSDRVDIYPEAYAIDKQNRIIDIYNSSPYSTSKYVVCTRPIKFGANTFKTIYGIMARGFFAPRERGKCGMAIFGSNDLNTWFLIGSGVFPDLQLQGSPYKYFRIALIGSLSAGETLSGFSADIQERWQNSLR